MKNRNITLVFATLALLTASLAFPQLTRATDLDGVLPGGNNAVGVNALTRLTSGTFNTAVGLFSLGTVSEGNFNTAFGAGTLLVNTAESDTATGAGALLSNTTGEENTANGVFALFSNTTGFGNTAVGSNALFNNTTGGTLGTTQGIDVGPNTAVGDSALVSNTTASANTAVGYQALGSNTSGLQDTDLGLSTAVGFQALADATGPDAGFNDAFGYQALFHLVGGIRNVAIGARALFASTIGSNNVALGNQAGVNITTSSDNICIGVGAGLNVTTASNMIAIGTAGANVSNSCFIGNILGVQVIDATPVVIDSIGQLGTQSSSRRFKKEIKPMDSASEAILALKPVTFHYKSDNTNRPQFGLIAEEVAEANPDLVLRDKNGEIYTVRYEAVNAMLLNEFLKEHRKVEDLQVALAEQRKEIEALKATTQKVSDKLVAASLSLSGLVLRTSAPWMVSNNQ